MLEEVRADVEVKVAASKKKVEQYLNKRVRPRSFKTGYLVLKETDVTSGEKGKLGPRWEGLYIVVASHMLGTYHLKDAIRRQLPHCQDPKDSGL